MVSETGSSQPTLSLQSSCKIFLPSSMNGATKPSGSKTELTVDNIPLVVVGRLLSRIQKLKVSFSTHHCTPSARSMGRESWLKSRVLRSSALVDSGMLAMSCLSFETNLWRLKPPLKQSESDENYKRDYAAFMGKMIDQGHEEKIQDRDISTTKPTW